MLAPERLLIVGASRVPSRIGGGVVGAMSRWGYRGTVGLVSRDVPDEASGDSWPWFSSVEEAAGKIGDVDLAVLFVGSRHVMDALRSCAASDVAGAIVLANAGGGDDLVHLGDEISRLSHSTGICVVGPGSAGLLVGQLRLPASLMRRVTIEAPLVAPGVAIVATSGALANELLWGLARQGVGVGLWLTLGSESDVTMGEVMLALADRSDVTSVVTIVESLRDGATYLRGARALTESGKSVLVHRLMTSSAAGPIAALHTGSARVPGALWHSAAAAAGVVVCDSLEALGWSTVWLEASRRARGQSAAPARIGVVTISGGGGVSAIDQGVRRGVVFTDRLESDTNLALRELGIPPMNPVDVGAALARPSVELLQSVVETVARDAGVDAVWCQAASALYGMPEREALIDGLAASGPSHGKPVIVSSLVGWPYEYVDRQRDLVVSVPSLENAIGALATQAEVGRRLARTRPRTGAQLLEPKPGVQPVAGLSDGLHLVNDWVPFRLPSWWRISSGDPTRPAAALGGAADFPVVAKADSMGHKARAGQVVLGIDTLDGLQAAIQKLRRAGVRDIVVQHQVENAKAELLMGCVANDEVGELAVLGRGGASADADDDRIVIPLPTNGPAVRDAVGELAHSWADDSLVDSRELIEAGFVELIQRFLGRDRQITGIELNPVLLTGSGCWIVDVRIAAGATAEPAAGQTTEQAAHPSYDPSS
jgi:acyl-CoA synthetase (NDP forming)